MITTKQQQQQPTTQPRFHYYISDRCGNIVGNSILSFDLYITKVLEHLHQIQGLLSYDTTTATGNDFNPYEPMPGRTSEIGISWDDYEYMVINVDNISNYRYITALHYPNGAVEFIRLLKHNDLINEIRVFIDYGNDELRRNKWDAYLEFYDIEKEALVATAYYNGSKEELT